MISFIRSLLRGSGESRKPRRDVFPVASRTQPSTAMATLSATVAVAAAR
jgi:hypothetical protein